MLIRLAIKGFKSFADAEFRFGPFTCIAGANASGKSNLFDAIVFLSALAEDDLESAAAKVRDENQGRADHLRNLFHFDGQEYAKEMSFEADMIVPQSGEDLLGRETVAKTTFLQYGIALRLRRHHDNGRRSLLEIVHEKLVRIKQGRQPVPFRANDTWRTSVIRTRRGGKGNFITTAEGKARLHSEGRRGRPTESILSELRGSLLSGCNAMAPTACQARNEMRSWRLMQLEPSALRTPDGFSSPSSLDARGAHLAAALHRLSKNKERDTLAEAANRLSELVNGIQGIRIDIDEKRELLTLEMKDSTGHWHQSRSLSDGTLRFLAMTAVELDSEVQGVMCMEEPENGLHPGRIAAMVRLLQDISMDTKYSVSSDNPLRQIIINTHSPIVVSEVPDDSLVMTAMEKAQNDGTVCLRTRLLSVKGTWRTAKNKDTLFISKNAIAAYLSIDASEETGLADTGKQHKIKNSPSLQLMLHDGR